MIFRYKPYKQEEINDQVTNLAQLNKLRDMCLQKAIAHPDNRWQGEVERYTRNIESGQRLLDHMLTKNGGKQ